MFENHKTTKQFSPLVRPEPVEGCNKRIRMQRIKLVHIISSLKIGGAESVLIDLLNALSHDHYEHHVIYFHDGPNRLHIQTLGIPTYHVSGFVYSYDALFWWRLYRLMQQIRPDLIHSSLWAASFAARVVSVCTSIPVICVVHAELGHHGGLRTLLDYYTFSYAHAIVAVSEGVAASLVAQLGARHAQKIVLIKNGIDVVALQKKQEQQRKEWSAIGLSSDHFVIGAVGRFVPVKLFDQLIAAYAELAKKYETVRLVLVGMGPLEDTLRAQVRQLGLEEYVVFVVGESAYGYYPLMDCFVLPSLQEGLSIALLEAMASERACIVTSADGKHPVVENQINGMVITPANIPQLVDALTVLIENRELKVQLGNNAQATIAKNFTLARVANSYSNLISSVLQGEIK